MGINMFAFLTLIVVLMLAISVIQDLKRRRYEWNRKNDNPKMDYDRQVKNYHKANWHKGFQMALWLVLGLLLIRLIDTY